MTWTALLESGDVQEHQTSRNELNAMRALISRDLADAALTGLSADRQFATAYNAALQASNMAIACAGYRVTSKTGHHRVAFASIRLTLGTSAEGYGDYFETCRRKRNVIDYRRSDVATETEASELLRKTKEFYGEVEKWIRAVHPRLKR